MIKLIKKYGTLNSLLIIIVIYIIVVLVFRHFFNENIGAVQAALMGILVAITAYYAWQTRQSVKEIRSSRQDEFMPILTSFSRDEFSGKQINLTITNNGRGLAKDIYIYFDDKVLEGNFLIPANGSKTLKVPSDDKVKRIDGMLDGEEKEVDWIISYKDIFDREYKIVFKLVKQGDHFKVDRGRFEFFIPE